MEIRRLTEWDVYVQRTQKMGRDLGYLHMPGSLICEHGYEAGKDCETCFNIWVKTKDKFIDENNTPTTL